MMIYSLKVLFGATRRGYATAMTQDRDLAFIRHQLNILVSARSMDRLPDDDERRYRELCEMERFLLRRAS
jgi:hypothetical protein